MRAKQLIYYRRVALNKKLENEHSTPASGNRFFIFENVI